MEDAREICLGAGGSPLAMCAVRTCCLESCQPPPPPPRQQAAACKPAATAAAAAPTPVAYRLLVAACPHKQEGQAAVWSLVRPAAPAAPPHQHVTAKGKKGRAGAATGKGGAGRGGGSSAGASPMLVESWRQAVT
jgi:hypothetical protein